jgi:hypothetical protein
MREIILLLIFSMTGTFNRIYAQERPIEMNFIITVNGELEEGTLNNIRFVAKQESGRVEEIEVQYIPGNLSIHEDDYNRIFSNTNDSVFIAFDHSKFCQKKQILVNYEIPFHKDWFTYSYMILRVYDLSKGRFKNVYEPLSKKKNYTYELDYSGGGHMMRVRIKKIGKKENCN